MTDLPNLIARLEGAAAGSRELSDEVLLACGWTLSKGLGPNRMYISPDNAPPVYQIYAPHPTESLDDALRWLVPEGWDWGRDETGCMFVKELTWPVDMPGPRMFMGGEPTSWHTNPALGLCIAALKALASLRAQGDGDG